MVYIEKWYRPTVFLYNYCILVAKSIWGGWRRKLCPSGKSSFYYDRLIEISLINVFWAANLNWNFSVRTSIGRDQKSPLRLYFYIDIYLFVKKGHSAGPVNTLTCLSVGLILYHCVRHWPNIGSTFCICWNYNYYFYFVM